MDKKDKFVDDWKEELLNRAAKQIDAMERPICKSPHPTMGWQCELYKDHEDPNHYFNGAMWVVRKEGLNNGSY